MNNKIAILTQPIGKNYGGMIQNYALQYILKEKGFKVETLARDKKNSSLRKVLSIIKNKTYNLALNKQVRKFSDEELNYILDSNFKFLNEHINISKNLFSTQDLKKYFEQNKFSHVIIGSDQTWRPMYSPDIYNYFLDFLVDNPQVNKLAYASSFGTDKWEYSSKDAEICKKLIKQFNNISVREDSGVDLCKRYLDADAKLVLDPTLLLDKEVYINLFQHENTTKSGLYNYVLDKNEIKQGFIKKISQHLNIEVFNCQPKADMYGKLNDYSLDDYKFPTIQSWLKGFHDADFVVTDSFHGTVFSIIFNKPFLAITNVERGASRFTSLLKLFNLEHRLVTDINNFDFNLLNKAIDYKKVNEIKERLKQESLDFLLTSLKK
ncbi:polysaccharide pyruvyl transferase family protein [Flavobacterium agricola]|uniref:Polysaccharide pyruvyl transferase family protein n=1 Tax=Flavobacterium agricola TaxID=2870839 RepID=A0ABY6M0E8_9FLAO|nr:polysaccharide pyruvyl transferase family protein [Flavobacterium agricola]UYW02032.1 polysaccharide pyruvyl transferase family protein [Flavobacterium agricola]